MNRPRPHFTEMTWRDKPLEQLSRDELLELVEVLHGMVWDAAENFDSIHQFNQELMAQYGGRA